MRNKGRLTEVLSHHGLYFPNDIVVSFEKIPVPPPRHLTASFRSPLSLLLTGDSSEGSLRIDLLHTRSFTNYETPFFFTRLTCMSLRLKRETHCLFYISDLKKEVSETSFFGKHLRYRSHRLSIRKIYFV